MPVSRELIGILAAAVPAFPINLAGLTTHHPLTPFFPSELSRYLCFQTGREYLLSYLQNGFFYLFLDFLDDLFALFPDDLGG